MSKAEKSARAMSWVVGVEEDLRNLLGEIEAGVFHTLGRLLLYTSYSLLLPVLSEQFLQSGSQTLAVHGRLCVRACGRFSRATAREKALRLGFVFYPGISAAIPTRLPRVFLTFCVPTRVHMCRRSGGQRGTGARVLPQDACAYL